MCRLVKKDLGMASYAVAKRQKLTKEGHMFWRDKGDMEESSSPLANDGPQKENCVTKPRRKTVRNPPKARG